MRTCGQLSTTSEIESEREVIAGNASDSYRYKTRSLFRDRVDEVAKDVEVLNTTQTYSKNSAMPFVKVLRESPKSLRTVYPLGFGR